MTGPVISPNVGEHTQAGDYLRKIDASSTGGRAGPQAVSGNVTVPAYAGVSDAPADVDGYYLFTAAGNLTLPVADTTPLGSTIGVSSETASTVNVLAPAGVAAVSLGINGNASAAVTRGNKLELTLANVGNSTAPTFVWAS